MHTPVYQQMAECLGEGNDCKIDGVCPEGQEGSRSSSSAEAGGGTPATDKNVGSGDEGRYSSEVIIDSTDDDGSGDKEEGESDLAVDLARSSGDTVEFSAMLQIAVMVPLPITGIAILFS